jgi:hypothetical protein
MAHRGQATVKVKVGGEVVQRFVLKELRKLGDIAADAASPPDPLTLHPLSLSLNPPSLHLPHSGPPSHPPSAPLNMAWCLPHMRFCRHAAMAPLSTSALDVHAQARVLRRTEDTTAALGATLTAGSMRSRLGDHGRGNRRRTDAAGGG